MKHLKTFNESIEPGEDDVIKPLFKKGDKVELKMTLERNPEDGDFGYSINTGEVGTVMSHKDENGENIYSVKFSKGESGQLRMPYLGEIAIKKHNNNGN